MILAAERRELRLQEQVLAPRGPTPHQRGHRRSHRRLEVVPALVRGVDAAEARVQRQPDERFGAVLLPGRAVEEARHGAGGRHSFDFRRASFSLRNARMSSAMSRSFVHCSL